MGDSKIESLSNFSLVDLIKRRQMVKSTKWIVAAIVIAFCIVIIGLELIYDFGLPAWLLSIAAVLLLLIVFIFNRIEKKLTEEIHVKTNQGDT